VPLSPGKNVNHTGKQLGSVAGINFLYVRGVLEGRSTWQRVAKSVGGVAISCERCLLAS
jgi:hypothetical protein